VLEAVLQVWQKCGLKHNYLKNSDWTAAKWRITSIHTSIHPSINSASGNSEPVPSLDEGGGLGGRVQQPPSGKTKDERNQSQMTDKKIYGKHAGPDDAGLHKVRVPSWETGAGSKIRLYMNTKNNKNKNMIKWSIAKYDMSDYSVSCEATEAKVHNEVHNEVFDWVIVGPPQWAILTIWLSRGISPWAPCIALPWYSISQLGIVAVRSFKRQMSRLATGNCAQLCSVPVH